jgi:4-hydroxybenzoate polyprenyltransferase
VFEKTALFLRMIKFSHTLFALPFALAALAVIFKRHSADIEITWLKVLFIVTAFTGMRSFAMAVNRLADHEIDAKNPRTKMREIPAGRLNRATVAAFALAALAVTGISAWLLTPVAGYLALPAAVLVASYSYTKRFTWACHFILGAVIALAPPAVYVALLQTVTPEALLLAVTLMFYIAGFDILYSLQDMEFDRREGLHSVPARFGIGGAMWISRLSHLVALCAAGYLLAHLPYGYLKWLGFAMLCCLIAAEHALVGSPARPRYEKIPVAFFHMNSLFSLVFLATVSVAVW